MTDKYKNELPKIKTCKEVIKKSLEIVLNNLMQQRDDQIKSLVQTEKNINLMQYCINCIDDELEDFK